MSTVRIPAGISARVITELLDCRQCKLHNKSLWDCPGGELPDVPCTGKLIYRTVTRETPFWPEYDALRMKWCGANRDSWTPPGFREGFLHWWNILFMKYQEVTNGASK